MATITTTSTTSTVTLKLLIDTKGERVLYAEAGKDFVDFIFHLLSLPVATVITLLTKQHMVGCLANLYDSIEKLSDTYILPITNKDVLLKPKVSSYGANFPLLLPGIQALTTSTFFVCGCNYSTKCLSYCTNDSTSRCPGCGNEMYNTATLVSSRNTVSTSSATSDDGGYVKGVVTYTIMDDLSVKPTSTISSITLLNKFNVKEVGALKEEVIGVGMNEGVEILKASLQSKTVLTDVFLGQKSTGKSSK